MQGKFDEILLVKIKAVFEKFTSEFKSSEDYSRTVDRPLLNPYTLPVIFSHKDRFMIIKASLVNAMSRQLRKCMSSVKGIDDIWAVPVKSCLFLKHGECEELSKTLVATLLESELAIHKLSIGVIFSGSNQYGHSSNHAFVIVEDRKKRKFILDPFFRISSPYQDYFTHEKLLGYFRAKQENPEWNVSANATLQVYRQNMTDPKVKQHMRYLEKNRDHKKFKSLIDSFQEMVALPDTPEGFHDLISHFKREFTKFAQETFGTGAAASLLAEKRIDNLSMPYLHGGCQSIEKILSDGRDLHNTEEPCQRPETEPCGPSADREEKSFSSAESQFKDNQSWFNPDTRYMSVGGFMALRASSRHSVKAEKDDGIHPMKPPHA